MPTDERGDLRVSWTNVARAGCTGFRGSATTTERAWGVECGAWSGGSCRKRYGGAPVGGASRTEVVTNKHLRARTYTHTRVSVSVDNNSFLETRPWY